MNRPLSPQYHQAKRQLQERQLLTPEGQPTARAQPLADYFFPHLDAPRYLRSSKEVPPEHPAADDLLYTLCLLVWHDQSVEQRSRIRNWAEQNHLHPAAAPIIAASYVVRHQHANDHQHVEKTASYTP